MRGHARRVGVAVALAAVAVLSSSCSSTPKTFGPCHHVVAYPHDGGYVAAFDWDDNLHAYGEAVPFTVCLGGVGPNQVAAVDAPNGVTVDPVDRPTGTTPEKGLTFTVTVARGGSGQVRVSVQYSDGVAWARPGGPVISPSGDGWRFTSPDRS